MVIVPFLLLFLTFIFGLVIGSFLNVAIMRSETGKPLTGRSHCDMCGTMLSWQELIPIASFVYQKGRCLHCGAVFSVQYPLIEFGTGLVFAAIAGQAFYQALLTGDTASFLGVTVLLVVAAAMIVIVAADVNYHIIPNGAVFLLALLGVAATMMRNGLVCMPSLWCASLSWNGLWWDVVASIVFVLFFFALWYFSKGSAMGFGDVKLIGATSLLLGSPLSFVGFLFAFWLGGLGGIAMLLARARGLKSEIAFGPFIVAGAVLAWLFGHSFLLASGFGYVL